MPSVPPSRRGSSPNACSVPKAAWKSSRCITSGCSCLPPMAGVRQAISRPHTRFHCRSSPAGSRNWCNACWTVAVSAMTDALQSRHQIRVRYRTFPRLIRQPVHVAQAALQRAVAKQALKPVDRNTAFQHVGGIGMAQTVDDTGNDTARKQATPSAAASASNLAGARAAWATTPPPSPSHPCPG